MYVTIPEKESRIALKAVIFAIYFPEIAIWH